MLGISTRSFSFVLFYSGQLSSYIFYPFFTKFAFVLEHKTCDIFAAELLRLMRFDDRLFIDLLRNAVNILKCNFSFINDKF